MAGSLPAFEVASLQILEVEFMFSLEHTHNAMLYDHPTINCVEITMCTPVTEHKTLSGLAGLVCRPADSCSR